jgi:hypothetical protein
MSWVRPRTPGDSPLGCIASGADDTPLSPRNAHTRHIAILHWSRPREGISHKTLRPAYLIPHRWKGTTVVIQIVGGLEATSLSRRTWQLLRQKSLCSGCPVGEELKLVFLPFSTDPEVSVLLDLARSSFYISRGYHSDQDARETSVKHISAVAWPGGTVSLAVLHADWHATLMGRDWPVSSVFTLTSASNHVLRLPTAVGFRCVLPMRVPGAGHGDPTA